jgi:hypothetical protein
MFLENNEPFVNDQECPDGNEYPPVDDQDDPDESKNSSVDEQECFMENDQPCVNDQECPDGNERSTVDDQDDLVYSPKNESSRSKEALQDEGSDFDHLADENSEDNGKCCRHLCFVCKQFTSTLLICHSSIDTPKYRSMAKTRPSCKDQNLT